MSSGNIDSGEEFFRRCREGQVGDAGSSGLTRESTNQIEESLEEVNGKFHYTIKSASFNILIVPKLK